MLIPHFPEVKCFAESLGRHRGSEANRNLFFSSRPGAGSGARWGGLKMLLLPTSRGKTFLGFTAARAGPEPRDEGNFSTTKETAFFFFF